MTDTKSTHQAALERLQAAVFDLLTSEGWIKALQFRAQFHTYSFFNSLLILTQLPTATLVSGYRKWQEMGRQVRKGERGIRILAPMLRKDPDNPEQKILTGFREVSVFDISQTDGEPIPQPPAPKRLEEDNDLIRAAIRTLEAYCDEVGIDLDRELTHPTALGAYRTTDHSISLRPGLPALQELKTLVHELGHALLHDTHSVNRHTAELEAETTAFLTLQQLGIDTSEYSFPYLANWTDTFENLIAAGDNASKAASELTHYINDNIHHHTSEPARTTSAAPSLVHPRLFSTT